MSNGQSEHTFIGFYENDADKVVGCTPVILNQLHAGYLRECINKIGQLNNRTSVESNYDKFNHYLAIYSTDPHLLDSVLTEFVGLLVNLIDLKRKENERFSSQTEEAFRYLKSLSLVCRYKVIASLLSHEVSFLEPLLSALEFYVNDVKDAKHVVYLLQVWLFIVCKNPFDLARLSKEHSLIGTGLDSLSRRLIKVLLKIQINYNQDTSFYRLTPNLLAQILTRNKDNSAVLKPQISESIGILKTEEDGTLLRAHLSLLSSILKFGKRSELLTYADDIFCNIKMLIFETSACYFAAKLFQRLALVFLPPKLASWRYKRGYRKLEANLAVRRDVIVENVVKEDVDQIDDKDILDSPNIDKIPKVLETFLLLLRNETDSVRTTSAKALGRICARLPKAQTDFCIQRVLKDYFTESTTAAAWHGGCLALAELSGRGCFLPEHLKDVVPIICDALLYDRQCNGNVTESNVRDAACYICWSFARAYGMDVLSRHAELLSQRLVCTALFDREVNVRRAASASFQENVGRHGGFADGIQILVIIDFLGVGKIRYCFEDACVRIAKFVEYRRSILDHLCQLKCIHWDEKIRVMSAIAIEKIVHLDSEHAFKTLLPTLCENLNKCGEFSQMQGYLLAISAIVRGLQSEFKEEFKNSNILLAVCDFILKNLADFSQFSLQGFGYLIKASCVFVGTVLSVDLNLELEKLNQLIALFEHILQKPNETLRECAVDALSSLFSYSFRHGHLKLLSQQTTKYFNMIVNANSEDLQIFCILSLNCLPHELFNSEEGPKRMIDLFNCFSQIILHPINVEWYVARIHALKSLTSLVRIQDLSEFIDCDRTFNCLFKCINDRTKTEHGDVGRYVREAALLNSKPIVTSIAGVDKQFEVHINEFIAYVLQRCLDTVDKTRATAVSTMISLLDSTFPIKEQKRLAEIFNGADLNTLNGVSFLPLEKALDLLPYRSYLLRGIITSMGSILEWTARHSQEILSKHLGPIKKNKKKMEEFVIELLEIGEEFGQNESDAQLFFNAIQRLVIDKQLSVFEEDPDSSIEFGKLCEFIRLASSKKSKQKLRHTLIRTLGAFFVLNYDSETAKTLRQRLVSYLASPYNSLRSISAEQLADGLRSTQEEILYLPKIQQTISILDKTDWNKQVQSEEFKESACKIKDLLI